MCNGSYYWLRIDVIGRFIDEEEGKASEKVKVGRRLLLTDRLMAYGHLQMNEKCQAFETSVI